VTETPDSSRAPGSGLAGFLQRAGRHCDALLAAALLALAVLVLVPDLGGPGLWDPWEMDRAHVARSMAGPTRVLVVEDVPADAAPGEDGPLTAHLHAAFPEGVRILGPDAAPGRDASDRQSRGRSELRAARAVLERQPAELLVVDLSLAVRRLSDEALLGQAAQTLDELVALHPALRVAVDVEGVAPAEGAAADSVTPAAVQDAMAGAAVRAGVRTLQSRYGLLRDLGAPQVDALVAALKDDPAFAPDHVFFAGPADPALADAVDGVLGAQRCRAQFRAGGETWYVPVLDYWLMSLSYRWFGFTEGSTRLPFLLWGFAGLAVVFLVTRRLFGFRAAVLAGVVLLTTPHFVGQARIAAGDISFAVTLAAMVGAFLVIVREGLKPGWLALFLAGALLGFFSNGLTALLLGWVIVVSFALAMGDRRRQTLLPLGALTLLFAAATALVLLPSDWSFWSQFKFMDRPFQGGPGKDVRTFDYFVRQIGFGCFPWSAVLPFALGRLWWQARAASPRAPGEGPRSVAVHGLVLWFGLSFAVLALLLKDFTHVVFPAAPAIAIAVGVLLDELLEGERARAFLAFGVFLLLLVVAKQLGENAEPVTQFLTFDPHFAESGGNSFPESVTFARPIKYLMMFAGLLWLVWGLRLGTLARAGAQLFRRPGPFWTALVVLLGLAVLVLFGTFFWKFDVTLGRPEARGLQPVDRMAVPAVMGAVWAVVVYVVLFLGLWVWLLGYTAWGRGVQERHPRLRFLGRLTAKLKARWFATALVGLFAAAAAGLLTQLAGRWRGIAAQVFPDTPDTFLSDLFLRNRTVLAMAVLAAVLVVNRLWVAPWRRYAVVFRALELFERPRPAIAAFVVGAVLVVLGTTHALFAELALHVSQKHIVETYLAAEGRTALDPAARDIFKHGSFSSASGTDANFYTNLIPELADRNTVIQALRKREDTVARVTELEGQRTVVVPGWDPANDADGDGRRDWPATTGVVTTLGEGFVEDATAQWTPDQWTGATLWLGGAEDGESFVVTGNSETRVLFQGTPKPAPRAAARRYALDQPAAPNHQATAAAARDRVYFLLPKMSFSELNHAFRQKADGRPIPLIDAASSRIVLAVSELREGEADQNWITQALTTEEELRTRDWFPDSDEDVFHPVQANWDDQIEIIGYVLERRKVSRRQDYRIKMFFRTLKPMTTSYKIFMHVDRSGTANRIHSDHWPLNLEKSAGDDPEKSCKGCFQTRHWMPGDIYVDAWGRDVPLGTPSGPQDIWLGFYNPTSGDRLPIKSFDEKTVEHDGQNRVKIGSFDVM
jgi:hypothetical protein